MSVRPSVKSMLGILPNSKNSKMEKSHSRIMYMPQPHKENWKKEAEEGKKKVVCNKYFAIALLSDMNSESVKVHFIFSHISIHTQMLRNGKQKIIQMAASVLFFHNYK